MARYGSLGTRPASYEVHDVRGTTSPAQASAIGQGGRESGNRQVNAAELFPERMTKVFTDPAPSGDKIILRPKSVARIEGAASGVTSMKPRWWDAFENYLRLNKSDIQAKCSQCTAKAA